MQPKIKTVANLLHPAP